MPDVFTQSERSEVMSRIRSRGNKDTELALAKLFRAIGIKGWRRHVLLRFQVSNLKFQVRPDFVFRAVKLAVFVDGCFWHGCPKHGTWPATRAEWWRAKILRNRSRDALVTRTLRRAGWRVLRVWEHELVKIKTTSIPHPGPLPDRGGEGAEARLMRRVLRAIPEQGMDLYRSKRRKQSR